MSHALAELGADLVLVDRPGSDFSTLLAELDQWQIKALPLSCDIEQETERCALMKNIKADGQSLSILVNNAAFVGTSGQTGWAVPFEQQSVDTWRRALEMNITAIFDCCQGQAPVIMQSSGVKIVHISSIYGLLVPELGMY